MKETYEISLYWRVVEPHIWIARCKDNGWIATGQEISEAMANLAEIFEREAVYNGRKQP